MTLRHPTFKISQPTGHFHKDELSLTLIHNNSPLIIDPGTSTYSGNTKLRNQLRSVESHSTFFLKNSENQISDDPKKLFELRRKEINSFGNGGLMHANIKSNNFEQQRQISFLDDAQKICVEDSWVFQKKIKAQTLSWNWVFAENIIVEKRSSYSWTVTTKSNESFLLSSTVPLNVDAWLCSSGYTDIKTCYKLTGSISSNALSGKVVTTICTEFDYSSNDSMTT